jgi:hypothetical protein
MATDYKLRVSAKDDTKKGFNSVNKNINSTQSAMKKLAGAFAGAFAVRQLVTFANETLALADNIGKVSDSIGVNTEFLQRYQFAAQQSGLATEEFNKGMQNFTKMVGQAQIRTTEAGRTLEKLGVQVKKADGSVKGAEEVFVELFEALDNVGSQFEKNAILADLMGRAGVKLAVMGSEGAEAMKELAASATGIIPERSIRDAERFNDTMNMLKRATLLPLQAVVIGTANAFLDLAEAIGIHTREKTLQQLKFEYADLTETLDRLIPVLGEAEKKFGIGDERYERVNNTLIETQKAHDELAAKIEELTGKQEKLSRFTASNMLDFDALGEKMKETRTVVEQFADTMEGKLTAAFTNFFDFANKEFLNFKSLATSIARAVINELIQVMIVEKMVASIKSSIEGISFASLLPFDLDNLLSMDGGGYTGDGVRAGGLDGKGGFMAMVHPNETVIDHTKGQSMGAAPTVNFNISTVDAAGFDQLLASRKGLITSIINNAMNNQGKMGVV